MAPAKKGKGGKKKAPKARKEDHRAAQIGPLFSDGLIDPTKGGSVVACRLGRSYEITVPPGAVEANNVIAMKVFEFEGKDPEGFSMEGRIVSNRVEIHPFNIEFVKPVQVKIPHFCADEDAEQTMYAASFSVLQQSAQVAPEETANVDPENADLQWEFHKLPIAEVDIERGVATLNITSTGIYYICSSSLQNLDFAVCSYDIPAINKAGVTAFNAVAFDWFTGNVSLWPRTSFNRPIGVDGPVRVKRNSRILVDFEAKRTRSLRNKNVSTFEQTFHLEGCKTDVLTGQPAGRKEAQTTHLDTDIYENISYMVQVIPEDLATTLENAKKELDEVRQRIQRKDEQASVVRKRAESPSQKMYFLSIKEAEKDVQAAYEKCIASLDKSEENHDERQKDSNKQNLPYWRGNDLNFYFGVKLVPEAGFTPENIITQISLIYPSSSNEKVQFLEVPEIPEPSARPRKVRVGSEKSSIYNFSPVITRATFAELKVNINLGEWSKKCQIPLSTQNQMLSDIRRIAESHSFGKELSGARFISANGKVFERGEEDEVRAQSLRPSVGLWGMRGSLSEEMSERLARLPNIHLSFGRDRKSIAEAIAEDLRARGFPVVDNKEEKDSLGLLICFPSPLYMDCTTCMEQYYRHLQLGLPRLHLWTMAFDVRGWLKNVVKEQVDKSFEFEIETNQEGLVSQKDIDEIAVKALEEYKKSVPEYQDIMSSSIALPVTLQDEAGEVNHDSLIQTQKDKVMELVNKKSVPKGRKKSVSGGGKRKKSIIA
uniref:ZU5 domain-containing protein n=1 Tax=Hanusia phi TaxID=3032 RepID=A0A7S0HC82_9CRYP|mmetsp:Transcript_12581/g.28894  ORF Transcript_12581/g.28894 Transcript_12581/m.28894 type:complete len:769 (+) Transcript_12581:63-2369(+)